MRRDQGTALLNALVMVAAIAALAVGLMIQAGHSRDRMAHVVGSQQAALHLDAGLLLVDPVLRADWLRAPDLDHLDDAFKETLERLSDGKFKLAEHPSGSLGGERAMIEGLQIGTVDVVITSSGPLGNFVPESYVLDLPFLFADYEEARCVLDRDIGQDLLAKMEEHNLVGLAWSENGFRHMTNSKRQIDSPKDAEGLKVRTMENKVHMAAFTEMGVHPTPMAFEGMASSRMRPPTSAPP